MPFFEVKQGGVEIPDGVYPVTLTALQDPKTVTAQRGPKAGQDIQLIDWVFAIDEGDYDGTELATSTSTASGPKSKMFAYLTALLGGKAPAIGMTFEKSDLIGRRALATIRKDDSGWPRIDNLGAMPASMLQKGFAKVTEAPTNEPAAASKPLRETVGAAAGAPAADDLPF